MLLKYRNTWLVIKENDVRFAHVSLDFLSLFFFFLFALTFTMKLKDAKYKSR